MRVLGLGATLSVFRWDLIYLAGELAAAERLEVQALAPAVREALSDLRVRRDGFEEKEDEEVLAQGVLHRRDRRRDGLLVVLGGTTRVGDKVLNKTLFGKLAPSDIARLGYDAETLEINRILGELQNLEPLHPVRAAYLGKLGDTQAQFVAAKASSDAVSLAMTLARSEMERFKLSLDQLRVATHGQLLAILRDKAEAASYFRPAALVPGDGPTAPVSVPKVTPDVPRLPVSIGG